MAATYARGFVTQPLRRVASGPLAVRLERGGVITGVVREADGLRVQMPGNVSGPTDAAGLYELASPAGAVGVVARHENGTGRGTVTVRAGETAPLTLVLQPEPTPKRP